MTQSELAAWQSRMGYTYDTAAKALGISRATYARHLSRKGKPSKMLWLACLAIEAGLDVN